MSKYTFFLPFLLFTSFGFFLFFMFQNKYLMLTEAVFIWLKITVKNSNVKYYYIVKYILYFKIFLNAIYSFDGKAEFSSAITPVFCVTWSFRIILI